MPLPRREKPQTAALPQKDTPPALTIAPKPVRAVERTSSDEKTGPKPVTLHYRIENGMFIVQGDVVAGAIIPGQTPAETGLVEMEPLKLWSNPIPFHIQPEVVNPERIQQALEMFSGSSVRFVPWTQEEDAIVFEAGAKNCYSYVGKVTKKQQIWISPGCSPADIAHEIMHALGFVHEQNRSDRDDFINVTYENIEEEFRYNFEKLPEPYMQVSRLAPFDYQSLMIYPPWMFAKNGRSTMEPRNGDKLIEPLPRPSPVDFERIHRAYGSR